MYLLIILRTKKQSFIPFYSPENCYVKYRANLIWLKGVEIFTKQNGAIEIGNLNKLELFHIELLTETKKKYFEILLASWGNLGILRIVDLMFLTLGCTEFSLIVMNKSNIR